jgi:palmitoyltransferase
MFSLPHRLTSPVPDFTSVAPSASDQCNILAPSLCRVINADAYSLLLAIWASLQLTWVSMLLFVQFIQVSRAMTTYENMFGVNTRPAASLASAFTSTGAPLDPTASAAAAPPPAGSDVGPHAPPSHGHGGHGHGHKHGGFMQRWGRLLGVDTFLETARGRGAASGKRAGRANRNPFSRGCLENCKDFWCDPAPVFGKRVTGAAMLGGRPVNYTDMYESPAVMDILGGGGGRRAGGYEAVAGEEEV